MFVAVIAIVLLIATMVYSVIVLRNFGKGLKDARKYFRILSRATELEILIYTSAFLVARKQHARLGPTKHGRVASTTLNRMSID